MDAADDGRVKNTVITYLGIAADEPIRVARHAIRTDVILPLVLADWEEPMCGLWCQLSGILSPTYETGTRDGCWFCHNQGVEQLRLLRKNYPELWQILLKWDDDSPTTFHADGRTVHDFERRFAAEDAGFIDPEARFKWAAVGVGTNKLDLFSAVE